MLDVTRPIRQSELVKPASAGDTCRLNESPTASQKGSRPGDADRNTLVLGSPEVRSACKELSRLSMTWLAHCETDKRICTGRSLRTDIRGKPWPEQRPLEKTESLLHGYQPGNSSWMQEPPA